MTEPRPRASILDVGQDDYGRVLRSSADLEPSTCCVAERPPPHVAAIVPDVHPEVEDRFDGCGSPIRAPAPASGGCC